MIYCMYDHTVLATCDTFSAMLCYLISSHSKLKIKEYFSKLLKASSPPLPDRSSPAPLSLPLPDPKRTPSLLRDFVSPDGKVRYKVRVW